MRKGRVLCTVILVPVLSILYTKGWLFFTTYISMIVVTITTGLYLGARSTLNSGPRYQPPSRKKVQITHILLKKIMVGNSFFFSLFHCNRLYHSLYNLKVTLTMNPKRLVWFENWCCRLKGHHFGCNCHIL